MTATELQRATWAYDYCDRVAKSRIPYVSGGGHGIRGAKPDGIPPTGYPTKGYDCSGAVSSALWWAGCLEHQEALVTSQYELEDLRELDLNPHEPLFATGWGLPGPGQHMTVRVVDSRTIHHMFLQFHLAPPRNHRVWMAAVPGSNVGWFDDVGPDWVGLFNARHPKP